MYLWWAVNDDGALVQRGVWAGPDGLPGAGPLRLWACLSSTTPVTGTAFPPGPAPGRGLRQGRGPAARAGAAHPGPHHLEPARRLHGTAAHNHAARPRAPGDRQHGAETLRAGRVERGEARPDAPVLAQACMGLAVSSTHCRASALVALSVTCGSAAAVGNGRRRARRRARVIAPQAAPKIARRRRPSTRWLWAGA
jgi:hypothetical protein